MNNTAKFIKKLDNFKGDASLYELNPPLIGEDYDEKKHSYKYVAVSATIVMFTGAETYIFPATKTGKVKDWGELKGSYRGGLSHKEALKGAGYKIIK